jgi:tetratricopeptide (TPR) repeat protein
MKAAALAGWLLAAGGQAMALDVNSMWDYEQPGVSEQRFREALTEASGDDALVLRTQIARTYSLRGRIDQAHAELDAIEPQVAAAGAEVQVRVLLERGRTLRSAGQPAEARPLFVSAFERADAAGLEYLAGDALHMVALVESSLEGQVEWNQRTAQYASRTSDPAARHWEAGAWNNLGVALNEAGRHAEALAAFEHALAAHERSGKVTSIRIAHWMVAHTLRLLGRIDEALARQLELEAQWRSAGETDAYVFEELVALYEAKGDGPRAARYRSLLEQARR